MNQASSYKELLAQRASLEQKIAQARQQEIDGAVSAIRELIAEFDLSAEQIFPGKRGRIGSPTQRATKTVAPKYRDPSTGQTWTGRGKAPVWIRDKNREEFLIPA